MQLHTKIFAKQFQVVRTYLVISNLLLKLSFTSGFGKRKRSHYPLWAFIRFGDSGRKGCGQVVNWFVNQYEIVNCVIALLTEILESTSDMN